MATNRYDPPGSRPDVSESSTIVTTLQDASTGSQGATKSPTVPPSAPTAALPQLSNPITNVFSRLSRTLTGQNPQDRHESHAKPVRKRDFGFLPIPKNRRHDPNRKPENEFGFTWKMNLVFAFAATVSVANLYYIQPMLVSIANEFGVSDDVVSHIPTLAQGGYGCGIVLISPLGDLVRRRQLVLLLMVLTTTLSIALALARNVHMLEGFSFLVGMFTVTPQICIPWTADLAPANIRARSMSITLSGLISGLVMGRVLAGVISNFASWRDTYWLAVGVQGAMTGVLWFSLPDTPDKNIGISYFEVLWSMAKYFTMYPTLVQACICSLLTSAVFAGFWTTLTFVLSTSPYHYNSFDIGLFGLLGIIGALLAPQWGRLIDRVVPWLGQLLGISTALIAMVVALAGANQNISAVCIAIILYDTGQQLAQVSAAYRIAGLDPKARARLNGCSLLAVFTGQTSGTAILTKIYNTYGWRPTGGTAVAFVGTALLVLFMRGPHEVGWIGWSGGYQLLKREKMTDLSPEAITEGFRKKKKKEGGKKGGGHVLRAYRS